MIPILEALYENENREVPGLVVAFGVSEKDPKIDKHPDDRDSFPDTVHHGVNTTLHFSQETADKFVELFSSKKETCQSILEIGVWGAPHGAGNAGRSTEFLMDLKNEDTVYLGIDIEDRSEHCHFPEKNCFFFQSDSMDTEKIHAKIKEMGIEKFDFIFIDGWHSINAVYHEWEHYVLPFLSEDGIVVFHDTNTHPGPFALFEGVDDEVFESEKYCLGNHFGLGAIWYRKDS